MFIDPAFRCTAPSPRDKFRFKFSRQVSWRSGQQSTFSQPEWVCRQLPWRPGLHSTRDAMAGLNSCALPSLGPPGDGLAPWSFGSAPRAWRFECPVRSTCIICAVTMSPSYCCYAGQVLHSTHMEFKRISSHLCEYPSVMAVCEIVSRRGSIVQYTCLLYIISSSLLEHLDLCEWMTEQRACKSVIMYW